ncbi:uncharacterized protein LOC107303664 [Oryza brachyantha]|uniref:Uncharacterized protein n=1 Tax=Oryza brachyantha TaxID=4533 RepID=J3LI21_ORYBR|nr:uncharacterized protein LOC107303664 [Oryza brachyantha]
MRMSRLSVAAAVILVMALMAMEVEGIRLDAETRAATSNQIMVNKSTENVPKDSVDSSLEAKRSIAGNEVRAVAHKLPEFHEDYYGPSDHTPRHH